MSRKFKDYSITLRDSTGKTHTVGINGDCINEQIREGVSENVAVGDVEDNKVANAIYNGEIGADCWIESIER
jgi:hypothetical protein